MTRHNTHPSTEAGALLGDAVRGWDRFWFRPADPTTLAFMRICAGLIVFYVHLGYSWDLLSFVGPTGWMNREVGQYVVRDAPQYTLGLKWDAVPFEFSRGNYFWSVYYHVTDPGWVVAVHVFFLAAILAFTLGLWTRVTAVLAWLAAMSYVQRATTTVFGLDTMMMIVLLYLMIGPCGAVLSVDRWLACRRARRRGEPEPPVEPSVSANFALRLTQVHFCVIYLAAGTSKLLGPSWWTGTAMNQVMLNAEFAPLDWGPYYHTMKALATRRWLWEIAMGASIIYTLVMEIGLPFLIWVPRLRWLCVCGSVLLHTGIAIFMGLTPFSLVMLVIVSSFIPPEVVRQLLDRAGAWLRRLLSGKAAAPDAAPELVLTR